MDLKNLKRKYDGVVERRFLDMVDRYKNVEGVRGNPLIYKVFIKDFKTFETGVTVIEPGNINGEFFMTKGHRHKKKRSEVYILISGRGKLLLQGKKAKLIDLKIGKSEIIPSTSGHRLINTGNKKMEVLTIYSKDAGHDYNFKFKRRVVR